MIWYHLWILSLVGLFLPAVTFGGEGPSKTGVVKGTITIGGKPTSEAVVSVEGLSTKDLKSQLSSLKLKRAVMDQQDLKFLPHVLPVVAGTAVEFANNDKTFHNVFSQSEAKKFDLGLYSPGRRRSVTFDKAGLVRILCNVHPNMEAFIVVKEHPYFAVTDKRGNYQLSGVSLGKYRVEVWHPEFGSKAVPFNLVRDGEVLAIDVDLKEQR
jgi:plastocyanin